MRLHFFENPTGIVFALLHIGLIEGMDAERMSRNGGRELQRKNSPPRS